MAAGVYMIENTTNGKCYFGSSVDLDKRWEDHRCGLRTKKHRNGILQKAWDKHGEGSFRFVVIEDVLDLNSLLEVEQKYLSSNFVGCRKIGYNICRVAGSNRGIVWSEEARANMSAAAKRRPPISEETRAKLSIANTGRKKSPESIKKYLATREYSRPSKETRERMSEAHRGNRHSEETKKRMAETHRRWHSDPENKARFVEAHVQRHRENPFTQEAKRNISESLKGRLISLETRKKISESLKQRSRSIRMSNPAIAGMEA